MNVEATARLFALGTDTGKRGERWCYLAGPMRSKPGHNYEAFNAAAKTLRDYGWHVFNPAETDAEVRTEAEKAPNPLSVYMQQDLVDVCKSDVVFVLEGWATSEGANLEVTVAERLGIPVYAFPQIVGRGTGFLDLAAKGEKSDLSRRVLDYVKPNGEAVARPSFDDSLGARLLAAKTTKHFDHEKGHLVDGATPAVGTAPQAVTYSHTGDVRRPKATIDPNSPAVRMALASGKAYFLDDYPMAPENVRQFSSGATRNPDTNKPDFEGFISPLVVEEFGRYMHEHRLQADGTLRSSDNWQKGMPFEAYMKSMWRHFQHVWLLHRGQKATDYDTGEAIALNDALCGLLFNVQGYLLEHLKVRQARAEATEGVDAVTRTG